MRSEEKTIQPAWARPENWPDRRPAPGYPRRGTRPGAVILAVGLPAIILSFTFDLDYLGLVLVALAISGIVLVQYLTLGRFRCPECGTRLPLKWPAPRESLTFHCQHCNVIWQTGIQAPDTND